MDRTLACGARGRGSNPLGGTRIELDLSFINGSQNSRQSFLHLWSAQFFTPLHLSHAMGTPARLLNVVKIIFACFANVVYIEFRI